MTNRIIARIGLGYLGINALLLGLWAPFAPRSFYDNFPGLGRSWVSVDGPYNEHLIRDVGALNLALAVVLIAAFVTLSRQLVTVAAVAALAWGVPHFVYHAFNTEPLSTGDNVLSLGGLALASLCPLGLLYLAPRLDQPSPMTATSSTN
jgi:hypothetical protein